MAENKSYRKVDQAQLEQIRQLEKPNLNIRIWVLPLAMFLCAVQSIMCIFMEHTGNSQLYSISTQISVLAFGLMAILALFINPILRLTRVVTPLNRAELMSIFAAMAVSAGISTFGLVDQIIPLIVAPFNAQWNLPQRQWDTDVIPYLQQDLFITDTSVIQQYREGFTLQGSMSEKLPFLLKQIPWALWIKPLALWSVFILGIYLMFYSLSTLLYETWARREKLVFPLARLPEDLMHADGDAPGSYPRVFRNSLFWIAFLSVVVLFSFNASCSVGWIRGLKPLTMGLKPDILKSMLATTAFNGIAGGGVTNLIFLISFTGIGVGFLLPLAISRSIWVYFLIALSAIMGGIWLAFGAASKSFPSDWLWTNNFITALAGGGLLAFSTVCLLKLILERWTDAKEQTEVPTIYCFITSFGWGGLWLLISTTICIGWLWWANVSPLWGILFLGVTMLVSIGIMRAVAEGGIYWMQMHIGPFHIVKMVGGAKVIPAAAIAPLMVIYSVLFLDIKTFIAPSILNSFKMQEETRASRRMFHTIVFSSIVVTMCIAAFSLLCVTYDVGANRASNWFFTSGPQYLMDCTQRLVGGGLATTGEYNWIFYLMGAAWVTLSFVMRRRFFWWLHPIGFIMLANPLMSSMWFSFFIGWLCKKITVKYGGRHMFAKLRPLFIGLILGEVLAIFVWMTLAQVFNISDMPLSLNRTRP